MVAATATFSNAHLRQSPGETGVFVWPSLPTGGRRRCDAGQPGAGQATWASTGRRLTRVRMAEGCGAPERRAVVAGETVWLCRSPRRGRCSPAQCDPKVGV